MKIKLWGIRGSIPVTDPGMAVYGGNTSCVQVWHEGWQLVLDGGSGIQKLVSNIEIDTKRIDILLTHLHIDHIQGLGFFRPLFDPGMEVHIWGPASSTRSLHARISRYLSPPLFPMLIRDLPCKLILHEIEDSLFTIGPFTIQSQYIIHPGPTVGYRITQQNRSFTYMPDHEPALGSNGIIAEKNWISGYKLAGNTDLLLHDAQYSKEEYQLKKGWGHSSYTDAGQFAKLTGAKHLLMAHHDPSRTDQELNELFNTFQKAGPYPFVCELAKEGAVFTL